jgi:hypothetical protein
VQRLTRPFSLPPLAIALLAGVLAYAIAPFGDQIWDDKLLAQQVAAFGSLGDLLKPPQGIVQWSYSYYRPIEVASHMLDAWLFGPGAVVGPHLANVAYHLTCTALVWVLARRLLTANEAGQAGALFAAVIFAVHPIHTESVSWIAGRVDVLATVFLLLALVVALRWLDEGELWSLFLSPTCFFLATLGKEVAVSGIVIMPLLLVLARPAPPHAAVKPRERWLPILAMAACWLGALWSYFSLRFAADAGIVPYEADFAALPLRALRAVAWYLIKLVAPWPQLHFVTAGRLPGLLVTVPVLLLGASVLLFAVRRWRDSGDTVPVLGLLWIGASLAPLMAALMPGLTETPVAERYLYLPSVGMVLTAGALAAGLAATAMAQRAAWVAVAVAVLYLASTLWRGTVWLSELRLWANATRQAPDHAIPWIEYGGSLHATGQLQPALEAFQRGIDLASDPLNLAIGNYKAGITHAQLGHWAAAREAFDAALAAEPGLVEARLGKAVGLSAEARSYQDRNQGLQALDAYRAALAELQNAEAINAAVTNRPEVRQLRRQLAAEVARLQGASR